MKSGCRTAHITPYCHVSEHFWEFHLHSSLFGFILYGLSSALFQNHASAAAEQALSACRATLGLGMQSFLQHLIWKAEADKTDLVQIGPLTTNLHHRQRLKGWYVADYNNLSTRQC